MNKKLKVAVIMGGKSAEHEVSISSGQAVLDNIDREKYNVLPVKITKSGVWKTDKTNTTINTLKEIQGVDVAFIMMHGPYGEDGTIQGLLEMLDVTYTGAGVLSSSLSMDKLKTKEIMKANGILIPDYLSFSKEEWKQNSNAIIKKIKNKLGFPCVVKPHDLGSSVGISIPKNEKDLKKGFNGALKYSNIILIERYIDGREIHCGVLGNRELKALPLDEVLPSNEFYDYEAKYSAGKSDHKMPADLPKALTNKIQNLAKEIFKLVLCEGMARVDFFVVNNRIYFNEINTIPGFTETSIFPKEAIASGISYKNLISEIINLALSRNKK
jgi:D-alanine-D-alanine ligase